MRLVKIKLVFLNSILYINLLKLVNLFFVVINLVSTSINLFSILIN